MIGPGTFWSELKKVSKTKSIQSKYKFIALKVHGLVLVKKKPYRIFLRMLTLKDKDLSRILGKILQRSLQM